MRENKSGTVIDYSWMPGMLASQLGEITRECEAGGRVSGTEFARLVHHHRDTFGVPEPPAADVIWVSDLDAYMREINGANGKLRP